MRFNKSNFYYNIESDKNNIIEHFNFDDLLTGPIGDTGIRGIEGDIGSIGFKGQKGEDGYKGDKGPIGSRGIIGPLGPGGDKGLPGPKGKSGIRGMRGNIGIQGIEGPMGDRGPDGPIGYPGPMGIRGDTGIAGMKGKTGETGYKGNVSFKYNNCSWTPWTNLFTSSSEIKCPTGKVGVKIETKCTCNNDNPDNSSVNKTCGLGKTNFVKRDCQQRLECCPYEIYDIDESVNMMKTRMFYGKADEGEERLINKIWITLNPKDLNKTERDYPDGFFNTENLGGTVKIITDTNQKQEEIVYTDECESKFCTKVGQHCVDNKICLDKINENSKCLKPPCWHPIPDTVGTCEGRCENLGQYCSDNKICNMQKNDNCNTPPCWNKVPVLEKCPGKRCPTPGQQCSLGSTKVNMSGFICKDEVNELPADNISEWCRNPPCWHKAPLYVNNCDTNECSIVGQKCGNKTKYSKICLDKKTDNCKNPPCWHNVNDDKVCSRILIANNTPVDENGNECKKNPKLDEDGKQLKNAMDEPIYEYDKECKDKWQKNKIKDTKICKKVPLKDKDGNEIKDGNGQTITIIEDCKFEGNCANIGRRCTVNGKHKYECMDKFKFLDALLPPIDKSKCNNPPCWVPIENSIDPKYTFLELINNNEYKNEAQINAMEGLENAELNLDVYQFTSDDRKGTITFNQLHSYMENNWMIFEANCIRENTLKVWQIFTGNNNDSGTMNYTQFGVMIRKLNVETFKYRDNKGRIYPKFYPNNQYEAMLKRYIPSDPNDSRYK